LVSKESYIGKDDGVNYKDSEKRENSIYPSSEKVNIYSSVRSTSPSYDEGRRSSLRPFLTTPNTLVTFGKPMESTTISRGFIYTIIAYVYGIK
jgi:hypothetical protein